MLRAVHPDSTLLDRIGTTSEIAHLLRVTPQAVSQWRRDGVPDARRQVLELRWPHVFAQAAASESGAEEARDAA